MTNGDRELFHKSRCKVYICDWKASLLLKNGYNPFLGLKNKN